RDGIDARRRLGVVPAPEALPALLSGSQCLAVHAAAKRLPDWGKDVLTLAEALGFMPYLDMPVGTLSLGTRQKLAVLLGLLGEPELILMDESFNGLDPHSALVLKRHLRERLDKGGCGLLLATHSLDIVERHADRALLLHEGRLQREWSREEIA